MPTIRGVGGFEVLMQHGMHLEDGRGRRVGGYNVSSRFAKSPTGGISARLGMDT